MIGGRQPLRGKKPGDRRVRVDRPYAPYFRYTGKGIMTAKQAATAPTTALGRSHRGRAPGVHRQATRLATRRSGSDSPRRRRWPSSAPTPSARARMRPRRSWSCCWRPEPSRFTSASRSRSPSRSCSRWCPRAIARSDTPIPTAAAPMRSPGELRQAGRARGRGGTARGLHPHGRGVHLIRRGADHLRASPISFPFAVVLCVLFVAADDRRQPPRPPRVGQHLRRPDVSVRGAAPCS